MNLDTPEQKKAAIKWVIQQIKLIAPTVVLGLGLVWGWVTYFLEDYVEAAVEIVLDAKNTNKSFRDILGEEMGVPSDLVPYHIVDRFDQLDTLSVGVARFESKYGSHLEFQLHITPIYCFIDQNGIEWWMGPDGHQHGVIYEDDKKWVVYHGAKVYI